MDIYLVRHTSVAVNPGVCYGQSEVELSDHFDQEVNALRGRLPDSFDQIYSSPSLRCTRLARQFGDSLEQDSRLLEYNFGDWEMLRWSEIDQNSLDPWMQDFVSIAPPNGENLIAMLNRIESFLDDLRDDTESRVLISTHAGVIRCFWAALLQIPLNNIFKIRVDYGSIFHIKLNTDPHHDVIYSWQ